MWTILLPNIAYKCKRPTRWELLVTLKAEYVFRKHLRGTPETPRHRASRQRANRPVTLAGGANRTEQDKRRSTGFQLSMEYLSGCPSYDPLMAPPHDVDDVLSARLVYDERRNSLPYYEFLTGDGHGRMFLQPMLSLIS